MRLSLKPMLKSRREAPFEPNFKERPNEEDSKERKHGEMAGYPTPEHGKTMKAPVQPPTGTMKSAYKRFSALGKENNTRLGGWAPNKRK
jgi:hypothetical protein